MKIIQILYRFLRKAFFILLMEKRPDISSPLCSLRTREGIKESVTHKRRNRVRGSAFFMIYTILK